MIQVIDANERLHWVNPRYVVRLSKPAVGAQFYVLVLDERGGDVNPLFLTHFSASHFLADMLDTNEEALT